MLTINPKEIEIPKLHQLLLGSVGPRPIALASTIDENGIHNLSPFSFFNVFSANPPILIFSPARNGRTNTTKDTYNNVKNIAEVVINVVTMDMVQQISLSSSPYSSDTDEFIKSGFSKLKSETIRPFRVLESPVQFECKVNEVIELGNQGGAGNLVICEILRMHINEDILQENGQIDQFKISLVSRMGGNWYCHANKESMFEVQKPLTTIGIGFDNIPEDIKKSTILTGNDLGLLASVEALPNETDVNEYKLLELSHFFVSLDENQNLLEEKLHKFAKDLLKNNQVENAWKTLLAYNN